MPRQAPQNPEAFRLQATCSCGDGNNTLSLAKTESPRVPTATMPERPPVASPARQNHFAKNMLLRAFSIPVSLCFPPGSQLSFSCHQNYVVLLTSIIHLPPPQYKYQVCFSHGVRYHPGLFLAACAATETTCCARCRDGSLCVSASACFFSCFSNAGSIAKFRGSWLPPVDKSEKTG